MLISACEALQYESRTSTIRHLNLSGCTSLRADIFPVMSGLFPQLRYLELAGMPGMFQENSQSDRTAFNRFLETLPKLEKLDIEETCGTCLDDSTLRVLARAGNLTHLQIGFASKITPGAMIEFIRACPTLKVFEADVSFSPKTINTSLIHQNTQANGAVIREFQYRHPEDAQLSLIDCRAISAADYLRVAGISRPRDGFTGYAAIPMGYSPSDLQKKVVIKAFWSWRRVEIARGWRETLVEKERELAQSGTEAGMVGGQKGRRLGRGKGWRRKDDSYDAKGLCVVQ
jgi:F-box/leucine-rich repeat protein 2/20